VLAFDELRDELEREIAQRRRLEKTLAETNLRLAKCVACGGLGEEAPAAPRFFAPPADEQSARTTRMIEIIDAITRAIEAGRPVNPALLAALRGQVTALGK